MIKILTIIIRMLKLFQSYKLFSVGRKIVESPVLTRQTLVKNKKLLDDLVKRRFIYSQAFEIHRGCSGLYDYGPVGCAIHSNIEQAWREHFILEEDMLQIRGTCITPSSVLEASGHVNRFTDLLVRDVKTSDCYRADKLLVAYIEGKLQREGNRIASQEMKELKHFLLKADGMNEKQMTEAFKMFNIKAPITGNELTKPQPFNLMFKTSIGPNGNLVGFLRPQTAQGIFVNFAKLLEYNGGKMPFASAQIGLGFRNEIAPRNGLLRVREFQMAEIEHFVDPLDKSHPKLKEYASLKIPLLSQEAQQKERGVQWIEIGKAVEQKIVLNETLGYFLARIYLFLTEIGVNTNLIRLRQLSPTQRAHYAEDCWDTQIQTSYGWVECVSCADRAAYDLSNHSRVTGVKLVAARRFKDPKPSVQTAIILNKQNLGKQYKKDLEILQRFIENQTQEEKASLKVEFEKNGELQLAISGIKFVLNKANTQFEQKTVNIMQEKFIPHVIEPSFGVGRIVYSVLEHSFKVRDERRTYFGLCPKIAPVKVSLLPLLSDSKFKQVIDNLRHQFKKNLITCKVDDSGQAIGKRYARTDEIGIPFAVTIDFQTLKSKTVTLRQLNSMKQVRLPLSEVVTVVRGLSEQLLDWEGIVNKYPNFDISDKQ